MSLVVKGTPVSNRYTPVSPWQVFTVYIPGLPGVPRYFSIFSVRYFPIHFWTLYRVFVLYFNFEIGKKWYIDLYAASIATQFWIFLFLYFLCKQIKWNECNEIKNSIKNTENFCRYVEREKWISMIVKSAWKQK